MNIYVFSDSHGSLMEMANLVEKNPPDLIIHLGDGAQDAEDLASIYPDIPLYRVPGNCDLYAPEPPIQELIIDGIRILFSHGHLWSVKQRMDIALATARQQEAHILLYGHTHIPIAEQEEDGLWVMNPGPSPKSYGIITLEDDTILCQTFPSG